MNRILSIAISIVFVIALAGFIFNLKANAPSPDTVPETAYENVDHGYSLAYPADLDILEYTDDLASIGHLIEGGIASVADVRVQVIEGREGESFTDAAVRELAHLCAADGPDSSFSCTGVDRVSPFTSDAGAVGYELYLIGQLTDRTAGTVTEVEKGPYYAFVLSTNASATKVLIISAPLNLSTEEADPMTIRAIAQNVRIP
jgi:hypothetical protein